MKIVTYNVNGLRPRISQFGSLLKLLDSFDADIMCFQETKLPRQELRADFVRAEGYESFFSCTRTSDKGRTGYSGVATFCRVKSAFSSNEVSLPLSAEEGFTGVLVNNPGLGSRKNKYRSIMEGLEDLSDDELMKIDGEGRCVITDHGHFVLFNVYGPRAQCNDTDRIQFKRKFFRVLQRRWESLLDQGRRIFIVGDLNVAPSAIDRCDAGPEFEKDEFRMWFRSLLVRNGGSFVDVFREKHPERREAYTCWPTNSGAEEFNFGARIDHILCAGPCLHVEAKEDCSLLICHVKECDILEQFKRWKPGTTSRWRGGRDVKLEGSDHVPVFVSMVEIPSIQEHSTPSLSMRYCPLVHGCQQTLVSLLNKRQTAEEIDFSGGSSSISGYSIVSQSSNKVMERPLQNYCSSSSDEGAFYMSDDCSIVGCRELSAESATELDCTRSISSSACNKKTKQNQMSQLSLESFFQKIAGSEDDTKKESKPRTSASIQAESASQPSQKETNNLAFAEWQRIQRLMQTTIPLCKGHKEPCVSRVVKKAGANVGRRFYVCARAEGPSSNSEANCGFFKWATSKSKQKL